MRMRLVIPVLGLLLVGGIVVYATTRSKKPPRTDPPSVLRIEEDGLLYTYHLTTDTAALFDLAKDPHCLNNLALSRPQDAARLRHALERKLGIDDLNELKDADGQAAKALRGLGYL
jgi:hypothetical protein